MSSPARILIAVAFLAVAGSAHAQHGAAIVVAEGSGYHTDTLQTLRSIASTEMRAWGLDVRDDARFEGLVAVDAETIRIADDLGVDRLLVLRLGRLRKKVLISLEELQPPEPTPTFVARLSASSLDEADTVIPRLVRSVLEQEPVEKGARIATMTDQESEPFKKRPGEGLFIIGVGLEPLGFSLGWSYEAKDWRLGVLAQGAEDDPSFFGVEGAWLPLDGNISPYLGAGLGVVGAAYEEGGTALGTKLEVGAEFFRLHGARLMAGVNVIIPFESLAGTDDASFGFHVRVGF